MATKPAPATTAPAPAAIPTTDALLRTDSRAASPWRMASRRFFAHRLAAAGLVISTLLILSALFAPALARRDPLQISILDKFAPPMTGGFLLGADEVGRDLLSRLLY